MCAELLHYLRYGGPVPVVLTGMRVSRLSAQNCANQSVYLLEARRPVELDRDITCQIACPHPPDAAIGGEPRPKTPRQLGRSLQPANMNARPTRDAGMEGDERNRDDHIERRPCVASTQDDRP